MNIAAKIARRYLFSRRSTSAINIISGIATFGLAIGTAALILILSVFNGFEDLFLDLFNNFNPDVTITTAKGKTFDVDSSFINKIYSINGIQFVAQTLEEKALFDYKKNKDFGLLKGVDRYYASVTGIDSTVRDGVYNFEDQGIDLAVVGQGIRNKLGINVEDPFADMTIYMAKRKRRGPFDTKPFKLKRVQPIGVFLVQQDFESQYVLASIDLVRDLLDKPDACSALEIKLLPGFDIPSTYENIKEVVGADFVVKNRFEQEASFLKLMRVEKWLGFAIVCLMVVLVSFNLIGALWMIVLEKRTDITILKSMGMSDNGIFNLFLYEGVFMTIVGIIIGFIVAIILYILQKTVGIIVFPDGTFIDAYPISMRWFDFFIVTLLVFSIGFIASLLPARHAKRVSGMVHEG